MCFPLKHTLLPALTIKLKYLYNKHLLLDTEIYPAHIWNGYGLDKKDQKPLGLYLIHRSTMCLTIKQVPFRVLKRKPLERATGLVLQKQ